VGESPLAGSFPQKKSTKIYSDQGRVLAWALLFAWTFSPVAGSNPIRSKQGLSAVLKVFFFPLFPVLLILSLIFFSSGVPAIRLPRKPVQGNPVH
jgi:hypothetical protein